MRWDLHGTIIEGTTNDATLAERWRAFFASRPLSTALPDVRYHLDVVPSVPPRPAGSPRFRKEDLLEYYLDEDQVIVHFPRYGQLRLDLSRGITEGHIVAAAVKGYGVLEDLVAVGLSPPPAAARPVPDSRLRRSPE